jgi:hypothetical protein
MSVVEPNEGRPVAAKHKIQAPTLGEGGRGIGEDGRLRIEAAALHAEDVLLGLRGTDSPTGRTAA